MEKFFKCVECGRVFTSKAFKARFCPDCREERNKKIAQKRYLDKKEKTRRKPASTSISEVMRDLNQYNKENGTCLSYGEYVQLIESGELYVKR